MKTNRIEVYNAIDTERKYQDNLWSQGTPMTIGEEILAMEEYVLKARAAWIIEARPEINALAIVRKIAGIAVRCMEEHGAPKRNLE